MTVKEMQEILLTVPSYFEVWFESYNDGVYVHKIVDFEKDFTNEEIVFDDYGADYS